MPASSIPFSSLAAHPSASASAADTVPHTKRISEWDSASFFSKWTFSIVNPVISTGVTRQLNFDDLLLLPSKDHSPELISRLHSCYARSRPIFGIPRLLIALCSVIRVQFILVGVYYLLEGIMRIICTLLLGYFLDSLQDSSPQSLTTSLIIAFLLSITNLFQSFIHHVSFYYSMKMGNNMKIASIGFIYDRLFKIKGNILQASGISSGQLVNLISNDVQRFEEWGVFVQYIWEALVEVGLIFVALAFQLNVLSALAGISLIFATLPLQFYIARLFSLMRRDTAQQTDKRVRHMGEVIDGISSVKGYGWEQPFISMILAIRNTELFNVLRAQRLRAINYCLYFCSPHITLFAIFVVYVHLGGTLTLPLIFSTMSFVQILRLDIGRFLTRATETSSEAYASALRIEKYLNLFENIPEPQVPQSFSSFEDNSNHLVEIRDGMFSHSSESSPVLRGINFTVSRGELLMVIGAVGSGKSSLLSSLLGETLPLQNSRILWHGNNSQPRIAYCTQRPWIVATTVKANITMAGVLSPSHSNGESNPLHDGTGVEMVSTENNDEGAVDFKNPKYIDDTLYKLAIDTCRLNTDLDQWPDEDMTEIGERGVSVSGGQKARIALARAVYSDADSKEYSSLLDSSRCVVYLLDDPLSAVDAHVGKDLFFECIVNTLKMQRNKGVILVTHQLQNMRYADKILVLNPSGEQAFYGSYDDLIQRKSEFPYIEMDSSEPEENGIEKKRCESDGSVSSSVVIEEAHPDDLLSVESSSDEGDAIPSIAKGKSFIITVEDRAVGSVTKATYFQYLSSGGVVLGSTALGYAVVGQVLSMMTDYWLRWWASGTYGSQDLPMYQWMFAILVFLTIIVGYHKVEMWFYFTNVASRELHLQSLWGVLHSPLRFFVANPTGRILNRFTKDQNQVDELFPSTFFDCFQCILFCLSSLALVCISVPWLLIIMVGVGYLFVYYRNRYIKSSLEVKRIEAVTRSPIYADFSATLDGLSTLRAYHLQDRFITSFQQSLQNNARAWYSFLMTSRWLGFRLDMISSSVLVILLFFSCALKDQVDVGLIGFALVYTLSLAGLLQWTVRQSAEVENQMTSVERIRAYGSLPPEDGYRATIHDMKQTPMTNKESTVEKYNLLTNSPLHDSDIENQLQLTVPVTHNTIPATKSPASHGRVGHVVIKSLTVTYRSDLPPVLKDLTIDIPAGYKVGICGRTGSGKSSLLQALLRLNIITSGDILVDDISLLSMSLEESRGLISLIPQDPHLFSGTVRFNIDPFHSYTDEDIWNALRDAQLYEYISSNEAGLEMIVDEGGKNFSVGQRQLLSLARAIVRQGKVILMDEVTASIDYLTDKAIQDTIRTSKALCNSTIITVAHRLRTIADSDLIGFIDDGKFVEIGAPYELLKQKTSQFRRLAEESNEYEEIKMIAKNKMEAMMKKEETDYLS